ncbi:MAG: 1-acyl-sn-glycerol-3-phosphate acyltransferase [Rhodospirillales bacterium]|nr:1-acyl-sn-glycerol-3-phosphate acyltransferase [Rhodospirillales bacterium]
MAASLLRLFRILLYLSLTLSLMPVQALLVAIGSPLAASLPRAYHRMCWRILGFRVEVKGAVSDRHPALFVVNHTSYLDITILGGLLKTSFIAKAEVARWPLFGTLARLQRTVFVDRRAPKAKVQGSQIARRLAAGDDLVLFPEGTSSDGMRVLPFKSALFGVAEMNSGDRPIVLQPVSIAYTKLNGLPMGRFYRPWIAWYGDMEMASHLWALLGLGTITVSVEFHPPIAAGAYPSRKALCEACHRIVSRGVASALSGREPMPELPLSAAAATETRPALGAAADLPVASAEA